MTAESPSSAPTRGTLASWARRRRTWLILAGISIGWKLLVLTLGAALPRWLIDDGVAELPPHEQSYALQAKETARKLWMHPIERYALVRTLRVMSVDSSALAGSLDCGGLTARVRAYTYFAIPYSEVRTSCDRGVVEYRVFRRRRR